MDTAHLAAPLSLFHYDTSCIPDSSSAKDFLYAVYIEN
jgi:hypothetical protein